MYTLSQRKLEILSAVVEIYVKTGEPVSSKLVCDALDFSVSSATVRNELAELSELGLLEQPHTSAGRVPSLQGYRFYINEIMKPEPISDKERRFIYGSLNATKITPEALLNRALELLAEATNLVALSTEAKQTDAVISGVQVVKTGSNSGILILMITSKDVVTKSFECDYELSDELTRIYNKVLNQKLKHIPLTSINEDFIRKTMMSIGELSIIMSPVFNAVYKASKEAMKTQVEFKGQTNVLFFPDFDLNTAKKTLEFLDKKEDILELADLHDNATKILLGSELSRPELADSSIILSKYSIGRKKSGVIGVVGPVRMNYAKTVSQIKYLAYVIGELLSNEE